MNVEAFPLPRLPVDPQPRERARPGTDWRAWRAPSLTRAEVRRANDLVRHRRPFALALADGEAWLRPARTAALVDPVAIELGLARRIGVLELEADLLRRAADALDPSIDWAALTPELDALLLELVLAPWLEALETALAGGVVARRRAAGPPAGGFRPLPLAIARGDTVWSARLWLEPTDHEAFAAAWATRPPAPADWSWLPLEVARCVARATLTPSELASLAPRDVILIESTLLPGPRLLLVVGERWAVAGEIRGEAVHATDVPRPIASLNGVMRHMADHRPSDEGEAGPAALDDIQLRIAFELGRFELPLGELRAVGPGHVFPLDRDLGASVEIRCGERRLGIGEIVQIEDQLGVRVVKLLERG